MKSTARAICVLLLIGSLNSLPAQTAPTALPSGVQRVTSVEGVTEYRLPNGLRILLVPDSSRPSVTVNITYLVGSRNESYGETGMAHLLEHMLFKGTPTHTKISQEISQHGADANAMTTDDRTSYFETVAATEENLDWALSLEADRMVNSFIARKDLDSEMTVVRNEFERGENDPMSVLYERVMETAYLWHNYGHPTIGARSDIERVPIEHLQAFYHAYYRPDNAVLVVAGKIDESKTLALIQAKFGPLAKPASVMPQPYTEEPAQDGERRAILRRVGDVQVVMAAYHIPSGGHPDAVAMQVLGSILSNPASGRLRKRLVDTKLATTADAQAERLHDAGVIAFTAATPKGGNLDVLRDKLIGVAQGVAHEPLTQAELDRELRQRALDFDRLMTDTTGLAMELGGAAGLGDWRLLFWQRDQEQKTKLADLQRVAKQYLLPSNLTVGLFIPDEKPMRAAIPASPDYVAVLKDYAGQSQMNAGEQFEPTPANIESRTKRSSIGPIKLAFLTKKNRGHRVNAFANHKHIVTRYTIEYALY